MATNPRNNQIAQIHIARQQLGMDEETYRDMLWTVARVRSAARLDWAGRKKVIDHLVKCGAKLGRPEVPRKPNEWSFIDAAPRDRQPLLRKVCAVCRAMNVGKAYAEGVAKRQHGIERHLEMMDARELWFVAAALSRTQTYRDKNAPPPEGGIAD